MNSTQSPKLAALDRFLENSGEDFLSWRNGCIVVSTWHDKQFRSMGGDTKKLISFFEDYCNMKEAGLHYIASFREETA